MADFHFFKPVSDVANVQIGNAIDSNFSFGGDAVDYSSLKKSIPHFEEVAESFGLTQAKAAILINTLGLFGSAPVGPAPNRQFPLPQNTADSPLPSIGSTIFGTPVYSNLSITGGSYNNNQGKTVATFDDIAIIACIFEINRDTRIIETEIQGRDNEIIEYVSQKSWQISCKGRVMSQGNAIGTYPRTDVDNLMRALNSNISLQVNSWFLNMAGIYNIVIKKRNFPQEEGSMEYQKFEFEAKADYPVTFKIAQATGQTT